MKNGETLRIHRYLQDAGCCAIAAAASVANFYDKELDYEYAKSIVDPDGEGMYTPDIARLMNTLGFTNVTVVTADLHHFDFKWASLSKPKLLDEVRWMSRYHTDDEARELARSYVRYLSDDLNKNEVIIDMRFGDFIRQHLDEGKPVLASFNWNLFFNYPKWNHRGEADPIKGSFEEHEVVISGYNHRGVTVVDSHHELYKGRLKKYASGRYTMGWETLMTVMGFGDLILVDKFVSPVK